MLIARPSPSQQQELKDSFYSSDFLKWNAFVEKIPVLKAIINANADAVTASWQTTGANARAMAKQLDDFEGNGKETFKLIMNNAIKIAKIGGDYYGEVLYDGDENDQIVDILTLPPDNVKQVIKNGRIIGYEETNGDAKWKPEEIFHLPYNPIGAMTHGTSVIEPMNNLLIWKLQVESDMSIIYHRYAKPINVIELNTDSATEQADFKAEWKKTVSVPDADLIIPAEIAKITRTSIPQFSILDPVTWHRVIMDQIIMGSRVPELALGTGSVNSEESARMQFMGFRQMIRWDQKFLEEQLRRQLFRQVYPTNTPRITFSFAAEAQEERHDRNMRTFQAINSSVLSDNIKGPALIKVMKDAGVVEDV